MTATTGAASPAASLPAPPEIEYYAFNKKRPRSEINMSLLLALIGLHLGAAFAVGWVIWLATRGTWVPAKDWWTGLVMVVVAGFGISLGNHRKFTHSGYDTSRAFEAILLVAAALTVEGPTYNWVKDHWWHHDRSDRVGDLHSPYQYPGMKGRGWAHIGWVYYEHRRPTLYTGSRLKIETDRLIYLQRKYYWAFLIATFAIPFAIGGWDGLLIGGFLRIVVFQNVTWGINSACHMWGPEVKRVSYRWEHAGPTHQRPKRDGSRHFWPLDIPSLGESYHDRHHLFDRIAYHGWEWYSVDPTKWLLIVLEKLHVVWNVEKPPDEVQYLKADAKLPEDSLIIAHRQHRLGLTA